MADLNEAPSPIDEEEFIQSWEEALEKATVHYEYKDFGWIL
jgi:hypothetical protein